MSYAVRWCEKHKCERTKCSFDRRKRGCIFRNALMPSPGEPGSAALSPEPLKFISNPHR